MSAPAPVPSKAAIHALRGLLFGTSCSLVLLAEERRQRIKIARAAVENGRRLKSLKQYSTNGRAAIEALQEEVRTDPEFLGWSNRSRRKPSLDLDDVSQDLGPDPRRTTRPAKERANTESSATKRRSSTKHAAPATPRGRFASDAAKGTDNDPPWSRLPMSSAATHWVPKIGQVRGELNGNAIAPILKSFRRQHPQLCMEEEMNHSSMGESDSYNPENAASLVRRAYNTVASLRELPAWFIDLTSALCVACQQDGHYRIATEILSIVIGHGPVTLSDYFAHHPLELIASLTSEEGTPRQKALSARSDYISQITRLFLADVADMALVVPEILAAYIKTGKDIILQALKLQRGIQTPRVFGRVKYLSRSQPAETVWFIRQLAAHGEHSLAVDTFIASYPGLDKRVIDTRALCFNIVDSVIESKGHRALEVLEALNQIRTRDGWDIESGWIRELLRVHWKSLRNLDQTQKLINHVQVNDFYGILDTYDIRVYIVQIGIWGDPDSRSVLSNFESLCAQNPVARHDVKLRGAFTQRKAESGNWDGVRRDFEAMNALKPFPQDQQKKFNTMFIQILQTYSKTHTWGETEAFLETYVQELEVTLDRTLVRFVTDRHGRCRDIKAMIRWLDFCRTAGYHTDPLFWLALFRSCRRDWKYSESDMRELHREIAKVGVDSEEFAVVNKVFKESGHVPWEQQLNRVRLSAHRLSSADERSIFERMRLEAQHRNWAVVQSIYNRAVHNGMGHSGRCLRLGVQASVSLNGPHCEKASNMLARAQSEGHDISNAVIPVILAKFDDIERWHKSGSFKTQEGRGWPFHAIKNILLGLERKGIRIADTVFDRAARVCLTLRNYREAVALCVTAAETNGRGDLCYNLTNFKNLVHAYTVRHEYEKLRWIVSQLHSHNYRFERACRQSLNWAMRYLRVASESRKAEDLVRSDVETLEFIQQVREAIGKEHLIAKAEAQEEILDAAAGSKRAAAVKNLAASERASLFLKTVAGQRQAAAAAEREDEEMEKAGDYGMLDQDQGMYSAGEERVQSAGVVLC